MTYNSRIVSSTALTEHISLLSDGNLEYLDIKHPKANAAISLFGAHLLHYQPADSQPVIWLSDAAIFNGKTAIRGGIPICWPWFGAADKSIAEDLPSHGFARNSLWQLRSAESDQHECRITLQLRSNKTTRHFWDHAFSLAVEFIISDSLTITLTTTNTDHNTFSYGGALHSYFQISQPDAVSITGCGRRCIDKIAEAENILMAETEQLRGPVDAVCVAASPQVKLHDSGYQRELEINNTGNNAVVLWNPWQEGAQRMSDMTNDGYQSMLCIEPAITSENRITVAPGESHQLTTQITARVTA